MKQLTYLAALLLLLAACSTDDGITVTPPIAAPVATVEEMGDASAGEAATAVTAITLSPILTQGLNRPIYLTHAGDERLFVVEKRGTIQIIQDGALRPEPFLDIRDRVDAQASERGLLSLAFHPAYGQNGRFFVNYTNSEGSTVIAAFQVGDTPHRADPASETILLTIPQPYPNHNGGQLQFGPDGYLYVGMGDGGAAGDPHDHGQNRATLLGALLRLDVDQPGREAQYAIPPDNPFISDDDGRNEIWATGLRNPWRFSFDRATGDLYIGDVGQNQWEEISFQAAGAPGGVNFGWNVMEGSHCYGRGECDPAGLALPIYEYEHGQGRCSVTGGYVYRGGRFPALAGNYFFGDFCSGEIWSLRLTDAGAEVNLISQSGLSLASFGEDVAGELYVVDMNGGVYQIAPSP